MKIIKIEQYRCDICDTLYASKEECLSCESKPVTQKKRGIRVGDTVKILRGDGAGQLAEVARVFVIDKWWGHYNWERYWHTIGIDARILNSWGSRMLTFDDYE